MILKNPWCGKDIDHNILTGWFHSRFKIRTLKKRTDHPFTIAQNNFILFTTDHFPRNPLKGLSPLGEVESPFPLKTIQILYSHQNPMTHLCDDMCIDIEVNNWKSHFNDSFKMIWKGTGIS